MMDNRSLRELEQQNLLTEVRWAFADLMLEIEATSDEEGFGDRALLWLAARALNIVANPSSGGDAYFPGFPMTSLDVVEERALCEKCLGFMTNAFERIRKFSRITEEELYLMGKFIEMLIELSRHFRKFYPPIEKDKYEKLYCGRPVDPAPIEAVYKALHDHPKNS